MQSIPLTHIKLKLLNVNPERNQGQILFHIAGDKAERIKLNSELNIQCSLIGSTSCKICSTKRCTFDCNPISIRSVLTRNGKPKRDGNNFEILTKIS
jgi:hypothetical protein